MAVETELKLRIAPEHMARLKRHPVLKALAVAPAASRKLHNTYYDTRDLDLQTHAMALRLRRVGRRWVQTLKGGGGVEAGLHSRNEWETPVAGEALDFAALEASGGHLPPGIQAKLRPVFTTDFTRSVRQLKYEGAHIELCMDSGEIRAGSRTRPISELELELKSGEPQQLFRLALLLLDIVPLEVEHTSKAEYGYRLFRARRTAPSTVRLPGLEKSQPVGLALRDIFSACLAQVQTNLPGVLWKPEGAYLSQLRAGLRRLDTVLEIAAAWKQDVELAALRQPVQGLCTALDSARQWTAFATELLPRVGAGAPDWPDLGSIRRVSTGIGKQRGAEASSRLASREPQRLMLRAGLLMQEGSWRAPEKGAVSLAKFAKQTLQAYNKQVQRLVVALGKADSLRLDELGWACRKLGCSAEIFAPLFRAGNSQAYLAVLSGLQHELDMLCDIAAFSELLDQMDNGKYRETYQLIRNRLEREHGFHRRRLMKALERFAEQETYWTA